jgi:hypothetical protein
LYMLVCGGGAVLSCVLGAGCGKKIGLLFTNCYRKPTLGLHCLHQNTEEASMNLHSSHRSFPTCLQARLPPAS